MGCASIKIEDKMISRSGFIVIDYSTMNYPLFIETSDSCFTSFITNFEKNKLRLPTIDTMYYAFPIIWYDNHSLQEFNRLSKDLTSCNFKRGNLAAVFVKRVESSKTYFSYENKFSRYYLNADSTEYSFVVGGESNLILKMVE